MSLIISIVCWIYLSLVVAWISGALYFDFGKESVRGVVACLVWIAFQIAIGMTSMLGWSLVFRLMVGDTTVLLVVLTWWFSLRPSNERDWNPDFSKTCKVQFDDDRVVVSNVRNTQYRSLKDFDTAYEDREYNLSELTGADVLILFWGSSLLSHPMIIFDFGNNQHLCISVEVRYRRGQSYNFFKGIYRQYELMYVVSDERDAILRRTQHAENQDCYLYRLQASIPHVRQLFLEYATAINELAESPRWYHAITDNCTTTIIKRRTDKMKFDLRFYMNGSLDRLLYDRQLISNHLPFDQLKAMSHINEVANSATPEEFSQAIRENLPTAPRD